MEEYGASIGHLALRLSKGEQENTRLHSQLRSYKLLALFCIFLLAGLGGLLAADKRKSEALNVRSVTAKTITLVDDEGDMRLQMSIVSGQPTIALFDDSRLRCSLSLDADGAELLMNDHDGDPSLSLSVTKHFTGISLHNKDVKSRVQLLLNRDNSSLLRFEDSNNRGRLTLSINEQGLPVVELSDQDEALRTRIREGVVSVHSAKDGYVSRRGRKVSNNDRSGFMVKDSQGRIRGIMSLRGDSSSVQLLDEKGTTLFSRP